MQKVVWIQRAKSLLHWCKMGLHRCKRARPGDFSILAIFGAPASFGTRLGGSVGTQKGIKTDGFSKWQVQGIFKDGEQMWCTSAPCGESEASALRKKLQTDIGCMTSAALLN